MQLSYFEYKGGLTTALHEYYFRGLGVILQEVSRPRKRLGYRTPEEVFEAKW